MIRAFVLASSAPNRHESAIEKLAESCPEPIRAVHTTTGRYNLLLDVETSSAQEMIDFVFTALHEMKDILKTRVYFCADPEIAGRSVQESSDEEEVDA